MKIWILDCDVNNYENLMWREKLDLSEMQSFEGREKKGIGDQLKLNECIIESLVILLDFHHIFRYSTKRRENTEILPLDCEDGDFYAINVTNVLDCIDYENSVFELAWESEE